MGDAPAAAAAAAVASGRKRRCQHDESDDAARTEPVCGSGEADAARLQDAYATIDILRAQLLEANVAPLSTTYRMLSGGLCGACNRRTSACECHARHGRVAAQRVLAFFTAGLYPPLQRRESDHMIALLARSHTAALQERRPEQLIGSIEAMIAAGASKPDVATRVFGCVIFDHVYGVTGPDSALRTCLRLFGRVGMTLGTRIHSCGSGCHANEATVLGRACVYSDAIASVVLHELEGGEDAESARGERALSLALATQSSPRFIKQLVARSSAATLNHSTHTLPPPIFIALGHILELYTCYVDHYDLSEIERRINARRLLDTLLDAVQSDGDGRPSAHGVGGRTPCRPCGCWCR